MHTQGPGVLICNRVHGNLFLLQFHIMSCRLGHPCHTSHSQKAEKLPDQVPSQKVLVAVQSLHEFGRECGKHSQANFRKGGGA